LETIARVVKTSFEHTLPLPLTALFILNKADLVRRPEHRAEVEQAVNAALAPLFKRALSPHWVSTHDGFGIEALKSVIQREMPEGNPGEIFEEDTLTDQNTRDLAAEYIREQCFLQLGQELPYSVAVEIETFDESDPKMLRVQAVIHVEKESQKSMVIGAGAKKIKAIGMKARPRIEALTGMKMFLGLKVKVTPNWSRKAQFVEKFGYGEATGSPQ
jgi:GTP-binding protein Era